MDNASHNPTLREQLDAVRPNSEDMREPDVQDAARAIVTSDEWRSIFDRQQTIDHEVCAAMQDVDVSGDLQTRLQDALATDRGAAEKQGQGAGRVSDGEPTPITKPLIRPSRRTWMRTVIAATAVFLVTGLGWLIIPHGGAAFTLNDVRDSLPFVNGTLNTSSLANFDDSFHAPLPTGPWSAWQQTVVKGVDLNGNGTHDAAIYEFVYRGTHGYLLVLPTSRLSDTPSRTFFNTANISYTPVRNVAWSAPTDEVVYLCFIDHGQLDTLSRVLTPASA